MPTTKDYIIQFLVELLGTFIILVIIIYTGNPWLIGLAFAALITFGLLISGGMYNPAVSTMFYLNGTINSTQFILFVVAQLLGGVFAYLFYHYYLKDLVTKSQAKNNQNGVTLQI
jgi:glycerol uptake facilitator-like aquaporin